MSTPSPFPGIDLIREGTFVLAIPESLVPSDLRTPYAICVRRAWWPTRAELFPIRIQGALPNFRIPLRRQDPDVVVRLQALLDECYRRGRYASLDYTRPLNPPLREPDQRWVDELLRKRVS
jgi:hypothetical protein